MHGCVEGVDTDFCPGTTRSQRQCSGEWLAVRLRVRQEQQTSLGLLERGNRGSSGSRTALVHNRLNVAGAHVSAPYSQL